MNLYRTRFLPASLLLALLIAGLFTAAVAQRKKAHKLRATALLELTTDPAGNTTARITPIVILDEGRFRDASIYKATPRPMAADIGIVYEAQKSGMPVGYVTISNAANSGGTWTATGKWQAASTVAKKEEAAPTPQPRPGDGRPILHRGGTGASSTTPGTPEPAPSAQPAPRTTSESSPSTQPAPQTSPGPEPESSDRPVLRRRSPGGSSTDGEIAPAQPSATPPPSASPAAPALALTPGTLALAAVSDNQSTTDPRSFAFPWQPGEQQKMEAKMRKFALAQLPPENAKLGDNSLANVVIRGFDVDDTNEAVLVLTAEIPGSYMTPNTKTASGKFISRYITLIARTDFEGNLQRLAVSVTDSSRLDVAPRLELIDAVDVDGDGYAELLFRQYSFDEKSFVVYGLGRSTVTKVFEGASQPLK